jgi:hypothetical protein
MYEHAIPQNIMEYEFKLFAGLTLKQFIYVAVSGGLSFALYELNRLGAFPAFFAWLTIPTILLVGITLGLGTYNKRTMEDWLSSFVRANTLILRRAWKKEQKLITKDQFFSSKPSIFPVYLAPYVLTQDEAKRLIMQAQANKSSQLKDIALEPIQTPVLHISAENVQEFSVPGMQNLSVNNTVAFQVKDAELPLEGIVAYVKNMNNDVVGALRSNKDGIIYFDQPFPNGDYEVEFHSNEADTFPKLKLSLTGVTFPLINISPI